MAKTSDSDDLLFFNGVNGATGDYGLPPMTGEKLSRFIQGEATPEDLSELRFRQGQQDREHFGVKEGVDPKKLEETGWGVVFAHDADPAVREALAPLLDLRREQAQERFKIYQKGEGYRPGEAKAKFLARHGAGPGPADPAKVPYYLLLAGSPEAIPYRFQSQLDVQYAVGRLHFDTVEEYARYAESVVRAERDPVKLARQVSFFGVANDGDVATRLSTEHLVTPLVDYLRQNRSDLQVGACLGEQATKANLARLLGGADTPALVFTASHGMEFPHGHASQIPHQGALLCQDWPGPEAWRGEVPQDFYFAADDLASDAELLGLIGFHFACYGAGTPRLDEFAKQAFKDRATIAPHAFLAALPTKMLSHPRGGALAVIGHVERAWGYSFLWQGAGSQTTVFESTLDRLLDGHPVGSALEYFDQRYAELSTVLADQLEEIEYGAEADPYELAGMWTANNDARGYVIPGDPAARLALTEAGEEVGERPRIQLSTIATAAPTDEAAAAAADEAMAEAADPDQDFGLFGGSRDPDQPSGPGPFQQFLQRLGSFLAKTLDDVTTLEVDTWVSSDMDNVRYQAGEYSGASLRASTRVMVDGDTRLCVPRGEDGKIDKELWEIHQQAVREAQEARAQLIKTAVEAGKSLAGLWKG